MTTAPVTRLVLLRHGQAEPYRADDASRLLVSAGVAEVERSAAFLQREGYLPDQLLASPYLRAQQTAMVVQQKLGLAVTLTTEPLLQPDADVNRAGSLLAALAEGTVLVATHMPLVAALLRYFTGLEQSFSTGALVVLQREDAHWRLRDRYDPGQG